MESFFSSKFFLLQKYVCTIWNFHALLDWILIWFLTYCTYIIIYDKKWIPLHQLCLSGWTVDDNGNYPCGTGIDPTHNHPYIDPLTVGSDEAFFLGLAPFGFLIIFNIIYFNLPYIINFITCIPQKSTNCDKHSNNHRFLWINRSLIQWIHTMLRCMWLISVLTTLIVHVLKYTTGIPRPNAYAMGARNRENGMFVSFVSGHTAIAFCLCYTFGLYCHKSIDYVVTMDYIQTYVSNININAYDDKNKHTKQDDDSKQNKKKDDININNHTSTKASQKKGNRDELVKDDAIGEIDGCECGCRFCNMKYFCLQSDEFNGNYWFLLPLWYLLRSVPTLCYLLAWSPMCGATYVGISRIRDYMHSDIDTVAGALIGMVIGHFFGYRRYYLDVYGISQDKYYQHRHVHLVNCGSSNEKESTDHNVHVQSAKTDQSRVSMPVGVVYARDSISVKNSERNREEENDSGGVLEIAAIEQQGGEIRNDDAIGEHTNETTELL